MKEEPKEKIRQAHLGRKRPLWMRQKMSEARKGKKHTEETKEKIKKNHSRYWLGKFRSKDTLMKISRANKGRVSCRKGLTLEKVYGKVKAGEVREKIRKARLDQIFPRYDSSIEIKIQNALSERGISFVKHKKILDKYQVDIFIEPNIIIECDGDYWHNLDDVKKRDVVKNKELLDNGFVLYRFWEHEINQSVNNCLNRL